MGARLRSWRQKIKQHWVAILVVAVILGVAIALIIVEISVYGTGFVRKTLWDWLQLLIIPVVLAGAALLFNQLQKSRDEKATEQRAKTEREIALDKQREGLLQAYLDRMSELLLKEKLRSSEVDAEVRNVARVRTITVLTRLDARRVGYVFAFLREAGLMSNKSKSSIVSLIDANLSKINWRQADLSFANLYGADLIGADLSKAQLWGADLSGVNLTGANLSKAELGGANFSGADLSGADLSGVDLMYANLTGARVTNAQLSQAKSLKGATMRDGTKYP